MSRIGVDEQFQFLISCIRHSNSSKVDFEEVAKECNIVTKGAAHKRYERLLKAHGINPSGGSSTTPSDPNTLTKSTPKKEPKPKASNTPTKRKTATTTAKTPKKSKIEKDAIVAKAEDLVENNVKQEEGNDKGVNMEDDQALVDDTLFSQFWMQGEKNEGAGLQVKVA